MEKFDVILYIEDTLNGRFIMRLFKNENFTILTSDGKIILQNFSLKTTIHQVNDIIQKIPRVKLTEFSNLKASISMADGEERIIGILKEVYEIIVSGDHMKAYYLLNMNENDFQEMKTEVIRGLSKALKEKDINTGIIDEALKLENIRLNKKTLIAEGIFPKKGEEAQISYYEIARKKPTLDDKDNANHYEMNLINNVKKGDWLGEKIPATKGKNGKNVYGEILPGSLGEDKQLKYDYKSIDCIKKNNMETLVANENGAVVKKGGKIAVDNLLVINGNVDYDTGNIDFDGNVEIRGTVKDQFSVRATKDISIEGAIGVGAAKKIESIDGDVYIKGGLNGKGVTEIKANNIFLKYVKEGILKANNDIYIGLYAIDTVIESKNVFLSEKKGKIIGGQLKAKYRVESYAIGNKMERVTTVNVEGFNREELYTRLKSLNIEFDRLSSKHNKLKRKLDIFENNLSRLDEKSLNTYNALVVTYDQLTETMEKLESQIESIENNLKTRGEGEIKVFQAAYPRTILEIKNNQKILSKKTQQSFYYKDNQLNAY